MTIRGRIPARFNAGLLNNDWIIDRFFNVVSLIDRLATHRRVFTLLLSAVRP